MNRATLKATLGAFSLVLAVCIGAILGGAVVTAITR